MSPFTAAGVGRRCSKNCFIGKLFLRPHLGDWWDSGRAEKKKEMEGERAASEPAAAWCEVK